MTRKRHSALFCPGRRIVSTQLPMQAVSACLKRRLPGLHQWWSLSRSRGTGNLLFKLEEDEPDSLMVIADRALKFQVTNVSGLSRSVFDTVVVFLASTSSKSTCKYPHMYQCLSSTSPFRHTLQGTNISFGKVLKMIFLFPKWDMLVPWRVCSPSSWRHFPVTDVLLHWRLFVDGCPSPAVEFGLEPACEEASPRKEYVQNKHLDTFSGWFVSEIDYHPGQWM